MKKILIALAAISLSACTAQYAVDHADLVCKDGVEYFVYTKYNTKGDVTFSVVPHYKNAKGELFSCPTK